MYIASCTKLTISTYIIIMHYYYIYIPSKNHLARNIQTLQVFFLQDLQDLAKNLACLALKMKLVLQDMKNLERILQEKIVRYVPYKIRSKSCKKIILQIFLATFLQASSYLAKKLHF